MLLLLVIVGTFFIKRNNNSINSTDNSINSTGKSVNVAIIDQDMLTDHPEFKDRIVAYYDSGCNQPENEGSYHGASVMGILAGKTIGVAPEVNVYYAAAPAWERDAKYFADSLNWIIKQNKELPILRQFND